MLEVIFFNTRIVMVQATSQEGEEVKEVIFKEDDILSDLSHGYERP